MYAKLVFRNAKRSVKDYLIYIVTMTICVTLFYSFLSISSRYYQPDIGSEYNFTILSDGMKAAICVITLFLLFLIRFVNHYMLRRKQKEFAVQSIMGMGQKTVGRLFFAETFMMGILSIAIGIFLGVFCSQFITAMLLTTYGKSYELSWTLFPDVHTFFPLLSPAVFVAAHRSGVKVIQTLHDTRYVCPNASSICNGELCTLCTDGKYFRMVSKKCFKNSKVQSLAAALIFGVHRWNRTFYRNIDRYIYLNESQKALFLKAGFSSRKLVKKYNSVPEPTPVNSERDLPQRYAVYCGRIGQEKGISVLCSAWEKLPDVPLVIMGAGPQEDMLNQFIKTHPDLQIQYLGYVPHDECQGIMGNAEFVLLPSICYEGCSMTVIEAFSLGKPVIATDIGFMHEAISAVGMNTVFPMKDYNALSHKVMELWNDPDLCSQYGKIARNEYENKYSESIDIANLMKIYYDCISENS